MKARSNEEGDLIKQQRSNLTFFRLWQVEKQAKDLPGAPLFPLPWSEIESALHKLSLPPLLALKFGFLLCEMVLWSDINKKCKLIDVDDA